MQGIIPDDIQTLLSEHRRALQKALEVHLPRRLSRAALRRLLGKPRYAYDVAALQASLANPAWMLLDRGGKRWRPTLFFLILKLLRTDPARYIDVAAAFELIHTGTLIVDDVEDDSPLRRGRPALHRLLGNDVAINAGTALYFVPLVRVLERRDVPDRILLRIASAYIADMTRLHAGQGTDIVWHRGLTRAENVSEREYLQMCAYKTGCLTRLAATVAAILGGATEKQREALGVFAETLGVVFQIQDDILNITNNALSKNKGLGEDITEGKHSLAVIYALDRATPKKRTRLIEILHEHTKSPKLRNEAIAIIEGTGALDRARRTMERLVRAADSGLSDVFPATPERERLHELARFLISRNI